MQLNPVSAGVNEAAIGIGIDQTIAGADVAPAVAVVKTRRGKLQQIDLVALHDVFHQRRTFDLRGWNRLPDFILRASKRTTSSLVFSGEMPKANAVRL